MNRSNRNDLPCVPPASVACDADTRIGGRQRQKDLPCATPAGLAGSITIMYIIKICNFQQDSITAQ